MQLSQTQRSKEKNEPSLLNLFLFAGRSAAANIRHSGTDALDVLQLNITSLSQDMIKYILSKQYHILMLQEHRFRGHHYHKAINQLSRKYSVISNPASIKHKMASGGCMTLVFKCLSTESSMLRDTNLKVVLLRLKSCTLALCNIYLPPMMNTENSALCTKLPSTSNSWVAHGE